MYKRMKLYCYLYNPQKNHPKWIKDLNVRSEILKLPREKLSDIMFGNDFFDLTPKVQGTKARRSKEGYHKLNASAQQGNNQQNEKAPHRMEVNIFKPHV